jgi:hypothetical protein
MKQITLENFKFTLDTEEAVAFVKIEGKVGDNYKHLVTMSEETAAEFNEALSFLLKSK